MNTDFMTLKIVTPEGILTEISCDSVIITVRDGKNGKNGGQYGIRKGHAPSLFATGHGFITGKRNDEIIFREILREGFARVSENTVTVTAEKE
ncbi:MAG: hypothetical protein E7573_10475 [Ruminococcaceae bacterium]|nr:hypothetical protein [Oscillospiraceae bacterium]MBR3596466.1 hypothetical protein [Clostridia bacterium]